MPGPHRKVRAVYQKLRNSRQKWQAGGSMHGGTCLVCGKPGFQPQHLKVHAVASSQRPSGVFSEPLSTRRGSCHGSLGYQSSWGLTKEHLSLPICIQLWVTCLAVPSTFWNKVTLSSAGVINVLIIANGAPAPSSGSECGLYYLSLLE